MSQKFKFGKKIEKELKLRIIDYLKSNETPCSTFHLLKRIEGTFENRKSALNYLIENKEEFGISFGSGICSKDIDTLHAIIRHDY